MIALLGRTVVFNVCGADAEDGGTVAKVLSVDAAMRAILFESDEAGQEWWPLEQIRYIYVRPLNGAE